VNDLGKVVAAAGATGSIPFLFNGTSIDSLQSLLSGTDPVESDMLTNVENAAHRIGNNGIITGRAAFNGVVSGFVMVPVPEPTTGGPAVRLRAPPAAVHRAPTGSSTELLRSIRSQTTLVGKFDRCFAVGR